MKVIMAILMGALSGFLIYMMAAMVFLTHEKPPAGWFVFITFFGGWIFST